MTHAELIEQYIHEHPGCTFTELEEGSGVARTPGSAGSRAAAGRARDALVREGRIETKRDGRCVRHYPVRQPGEVTVGDWAHVYGGGHHLIVAADDPTPAQPVRTACGKHFERSRIWHDPPKPWMNRCKTCQSCHGTS